MKKTRIGLTLCFLPLLPASGAIVSTDAVNEDAAGFDAGITTSLVTAGQASLQSVAVSRGTDAGFSTLGLNDGQAVGVAPPPDPNFPTAQATLTFFDGLNSVPATIAFQLSGAYNITSIATLAGWGDSYFGSQQFTVAVEANNSGSFTPLGGIFGETPYTPPAPPGFPEVADSGYATLTTIFDDSAAYLATDVTGIRFTFTDPYPDIPSLNGIVIREISVNGTAVPEPGLALLGSLGLLALLRRRRA